jgi:hypothetical protein
VRLQKLDARDRLSEVVLVPPAAEDEESATVEEVSVTEGGASLTEKAALTEDDLVAEENPSTEA